MFTKDPHSSSREGASNVAEPYSSEKRIHARRGVTRSVVTLRRQLLVTRLKLRGLEFLRLILEESTDTIKNRVSRRIRSHKVKRTASHL